MVTQVHEGVITNESLESRITRVNEEIEAKKTSIKNLYTHLLSQFHIHDKTITKEQLIELKVYLGSEMQLTAQAEGKKMIDILTHLYLCDINEANGITASVNIIIQAKIQSLMSMNTIGFPNSGGAFEHNPELINIPLPEFLSKSGIVIQKRSLPDIHTLVELVSLMIVKRELSAAKTIEALQNVVANKASISKIGG